MYRRLLPAYVKDGLLKPRRQLLVPIALFSCLVLVLVIAGWPFGGAEEGPPDRVTAEGLARPSDPPVRDCRGRVEGGRLSPESGDTVIGPVAFLGARATYRSASRDREAIASRRADDTWFNSQPIKAIALVEAGREVTLSVPPDQRGWMRLVYTGDLQRPHTAITLRACRRSPDPREQAQECGWHPYTACAWRNTQFAGALYIDFVHAPERGRCARLAVWIDDVDAPLLEPLFARGCP